MASYSAVNNNNLYLSPMYGDSTSGFVNPAGKKRISNWIKWGIPVAILVIIAAVLGGVLGSRAHKHNDNDSASTANASSSSGEAAASSAASVKNEIGVFATSTDSFYMVPVYPSTTNTAAFTTPTFILSNNAKLAWPTDPFQPSNPSVQTTRTDRPRLIAPAYKWQALPSLIANDVYLASWNDTIFGNATTWYSMDPVPYYMDGSSGILDVAREIKSRIKGFAYTYRMTNDTRWVDRAWLEIQSAAGNGTSTTWPTADPWNSGHFLDTAELSAAFGIGYDWLYDVWTDDQKEKIRYSLNTFGLGPGLAQYTDNTGWWRNNVTGNWNCVCNSGLTMGSLAILGDDNAGYATKLLDQTVSNAKDNCAEAVSTDGTWAETPNYWYFGTTGHAEMSAALLSATGSHYGLLDVNANFNRTGDFHMYVSGPTSLFDYGDHGPNKYSSTANSIIFYASQYNVPDYALFQRDQHDAAEPWSMFWYDPTISGAFWDGKALDHSFDNSLDQWVSMRSSWTDIDALYVGMKAGMNQGHQTHNDLDVGDFVLDAMGTRWAGEFGSGDYLSPNYFSNDTQDSDRWKYYRKMTEGQNTILVNKANQLVGAAPTIVKYESSGTVQGSSTVLELDKTSTAYWIADMTSAYSEASSVKRGVRLLNGRRQVLIQDEITATAGIQWRMQTNATISADGSTATLTRDGKTMKVSIISPSSGASFTTSDAVRFDTDPTPPAPDQPNPGITVLIIALDAGTYNLQVLFSPQWDGDSTDSVTPSSVDLSSWTLTSHN